MTWREGDPISSCLEHQKREMETHQLISQEKNSLEAKLAMAEVEEVLEGRA